MVDFFPGPTILPSTPNTAQNFPIVVPDNVQRRKGNITGYLIENYSSFAALFIGEGGLAFHLWPYTGVFIPTGPFVPLSVTTDAQQSRPLTTWDISATAFHAFYDGDETPEPYRVYSILSTPISKFSSRLNQAVISASQGNMGSVHTTTLGPFAVSTLPGGGLYLTRVSAWFGNPTAAAAGDITLTDIANTVWDDYHLNLTTAGPQVIISVNYTEPIVGSVNAGNAQWNFVQPIITNGPGYSVTLIGYLV